MKIVIGDISYNDSSNKINITYMIQNCLWNGSEWVLSLVPVLKQKLDIFPTIEHFSLPRNAHK
jgi:hypothetical protein